MFECLRGKTIDQNACDHSVKDRENDCHYTKYHDRHTQLHHRKAHKIGYACNDAVSAAFQFCLGIVRLKQVVNRQVVNREKQAHTKNRDDKDHIVEWIIGSAAYQ